MKKLLLTWLLSAAFILFAAEPVREMNSILASVNGDAVTLMDVLPLTMAKEFQISAVYSGELLNREIQQLRKKAVDRLIDHRLLQLEYLKQSIRISNQDIERELDRISELMGCRSREEWIGKLRKEGTTLEQMRQDVEKNMMAQLMMQRRIVINGEPTPQELYDYFKSHEKEYATSEKVGLSMLKIGLNHPDIQKTVQAVSAKLNLPDADFTALVREYSPEFGNGDLGEIDRSLLRPEFATALKDISVGKIIGPLNIDDGMVWLKVNSHRNAVAANFGAVEQRIREDMQKKRREEVLNGYFQKLRSQAVIEYYF